MESGPEQHRTDDGEGRLISTRDYQHIVTRDNARAHYGDNHYGDQNHYHYAKPGEGAKIHKDPLQELLDSLSFPQKNYRFTTIEPAYRQTCQWLFETREYARWRNWDLRQAHHGILWLKGKPGTGKSTITKHALEHANATYLGERNIHFFFNARGDKLEKCTEGMFRSLIYQVAPDVPSLLQYIHPEAVEGYTSTGWPVDLLRSLFREAALQLASNTKLNCYIDALDEGEDEDQVRDMVAFFEELSETAVSKDIRLSIYFASRHYPHISVAHSEVIILDDYKGHHGDIVSYVQNRLVCRQPSLKEELVTDVIQRSSGIFLWVILVVRILNTESDRGTQHRLRTCLQAIPKGLHDLFGGIIGNSDAEGTLLPTLLWVLFAKRSLSPLELYLAVVHCTDPGSPSSVIWDFEAVHRTSIKNFITSSSRGLLQVVAPTQYVTHTLWYERSSVNPPGRGLVVQFIHESVRDYLLGTDLTRLDSTLTGNLVGISNLRLARWCQSYVELGLQHGDFTPSKKNDADAILPLLRHMDKVAPFAKYALTSILHYSEVAASRGLDVPIPFKDYLHDSFPLAGAYMGILQTSSVTRQLLFHVLVGEGYSNLLLKFLQSCDHTARQSYHSMPIKRRRDSHSVALHLAAQRRRLNVLWVLLENGADVNAPDGYGDTVLLYAVNNKLPEMIQMVLEHGADANARDRLGKTALHRLVEAGDLEAFETLMRYGADVNARDSEYRTPLILAAKHAQLAMVKTALAHDADINAADELGDTALHWAFLSSISEKTGIPDILLRHGADVNVHGYDSAPLLTAVVRDRFRGIKDVQLLLHHGVDVNASDRSSHKAADVNPRSKFKVAYAIEGEEWWKKYMGCDVQGCRRMEQFTDLRDTIPNAYQSQKLVC